VRAYHKTEGNLKKRKQLIIFSSEQNNRGEREERKRGVR
jgi:hypothetical protein